MPDAVGRRQVAAHWRRDVNLLDELFRALLEELKTGRLSAVPLINRERRPHPVSCKVCRAIHLYLLKKWYCIPVSIMVVFLVDNG